MVITLRELELSLSLEKKRLTTQDLTATEIDQILKDWRIEPPELLDLEKVLDRLLELARENDSSVMHIPTEVGENDIFLGLDEKPH